MALAVVLVVALWLRVTGLGFGLPYLYNSDEPNKVRIALDMVQKGDLNPHFFKKPTLFMYANAALMLPYFAWAKATGKIESVGKVKAPVQLMLGVGRIDNPDLMLLGRALSAGVGMLGVGLAFVVGRRYFSRDEPALLGALALAVSPRHVIESHYIETNVFVVAGLLGVCWAALKLYERGSRNDYLLTGFLVGIAASCKYTGVVGIVFFVTAHFLRSGWKVVLSRDLLLGLLAVPVGLLLGTPYALLDLPAFLKDTVFEVRHYSSGHDGFEGNAPLWYLKYAWTVEGPLMAVSLYAVYRAVRTRNERQLLLASFPVVFYLFISAFRVRNPQTFLPVVPFAALLGANALFDLAVKLRAMSGPLWQRLAGGGALSIAVAGSVGVPLGQAIEADRLFVGPAPRELARVWIEENIPEGKKIALESQTPWVSSKRYRVKAYRRLINNPAEFYVKSGVQYLVLSEAMFGRYLGDSERYPDEVKRYNELFQRFPLIQSFADGEFEIRILAVAAPGNEHSPTRGSERGRKRGHR